jgi:hypothetical protein
MDATDESLMEIEPFELFINAIRSSNQGKIQRPIRVIL